MTEPGNGWSEHRGLVLQTLDQHTDQLKSLDNKVWTLIFAAFAAMVSAVATWIIPRPSDSDAAKLNKSVTALVDELQKQNLVPDPPHHIREDR